MSTLVVLRLVPGADIDRVAALLDGEVHALWQLYAEGVVTQVNLTADPTTVVLQLAERDPARARAALQALPLVADGLMSADVHVLLPFRNWQRLFAEREHDQP